MQGYKGCILIKAIVLFSSSLLKLGVRKRERERRREREGEKERKREREREKERERKREGGEIERRQSLSFFIIMYLIFSG